MATVLTESPRPDSFIISEANGTRSREVVTIASGEGKLNPGQVLRLEDNKYKRVTTDAHAAAAILAAPVDATSADAKAVVIVRHAEVAWSRLIGTRANTRAQLTALGIICRGE